MYEQLRKYILPQLIPSKTRVMVAVSGGPDSMALSHILWRYSQDESWREISLVLTHVHHGVRPESDEEADMVQQIARLWNIPCRIHRFHAKQYAKSTGQSFQEAAREWRYTRWKEDMVEEGCLLLATAHHLGDQAETILYRLLRGSGAAGLAGMYPSKDSIIRPLLPYTKADILNYCKREAVPYALDPSNEEPVYVRNRIRLELLPELERSYNSRIQEALGRTGELLRWDEEYLTQQVEIAWRRYYYKDSQETISLSRDIFNEPPAILSRLLRRAAMQVTQEPRGLGFAYVTKIMASQGKPGWVQDLPGMQVKTTEKGLQFSRVDFRQLDGIIGKADERELKINIPLVIGKWIEIPSLRAAIGLWRSSKPPEMTNCESSEAQTAVFSTELLTRVSDQTLVCRTRREGDKMWFKDVGHKSLKKVFQEAKVAAKARSSMLLIAHGTEVLWIPGIRQSGLYYADDNVDKVCCILATPMRSSNLDSL